MGVVRTLTQEAHIPEAEVRAMTKADAIARMAHFYRTRDVTALAAGSDTTPIRMTTTKSVITIGTITN